MVEKFLFIAHLPLCKDFIYESWIQSVDSSFLMKRIRKSKSGGSTSVWLPDPSALPSKMLRGYRPECFEFASMNDEKESGLSRELLSKRRKISPNAVLGLLWVDLKHTIDFRDDAVQDLRERGLEEPDNVDDFLALGYEAEQVEAVRLTGFSTRIEKVKVSNYEDTLFRQRPDLCSEDGPWLINVIDMSHGNQFSDHEIQELRSYLKDAFKKIPVEVAQERLRMISSKFPKTSRGIILSTEYFSLKDPREKLEFICQRSDKIAAAVPGFELPAYEHFIYHDLQNDVIVAHLMVYC